MKKKIFAGILTALTAFVLCFGLAACNVTPSAAFAGNAYVALDINPSVELVVQDGKVTSVRALNYDARVMLYGSEGIVGSPPAEAARKIAALALKFGYVTENNRSVGLTVASGNETTKTEIFDAVSTAVTDEAGKSGLTVTVGEDAGASAERELAKLKAAYPDNAAVQALTAADYRIVKAAMNADKTLTVETAVNMDLDDLTEVIEDAYEKYGVYSDDKFELALKSAEYDYLEKAWAIADPAYEEADAERGAEYVALRKAYLTLDRIEEIDGELAELSVITEDDLRFIAAKLGLDETATASFIDGVKDGDGYIDEDGIEFYLDKLERNFAGDEDEEEAFEDLCEEIEDYLDEIEDRAETMTAELKAKAAAAAESVKEYVELGAIETYDDVEDAAETLEERIEELEDYFDDRFTDAQKQTVKDYLASVADELDGAKAAYDKALADAKTAMASALEEAQRLRLEIVA